MVLPLYWPGRYFFYPIGNTSAVSLTRDLAPETDGKILLLGCGDPRNILYTIFCEPDHVQRTLDFTCCDVDPAILARNVILLTMVADHEASPATIWNIFYHMRLDEAALVVLVSHCRKLLDISLTLKQWRTSVYSHFIKICTEYTLTELRRHWSLYATMQHIPSQRKVAIEAEITERSTFAKQNIITAMISAARSAGPLVTRAMPLCTQLFDEYWTAGGNFVSPNEARRSRLPNPTFVYSLGGEGCSVHYGTSPIVSFHLASTLGNSNKEPTAAQIVTAVRAEFSAWCLSFYKSVVTQTSKTLPIIRFILGESTAVCRSLRAYATTRVLTAGNPVANWNTQLITLDQHEYLAAGAPTTFNIIDTSNLDDHIGSFNVLVAAVPLLPISPQYFVLYTESLLFRDLDATKEFADLLYSDLSTFGLLIGICPVDYLAGFSSRSNMHELIMYDAMKKTLDAGQFHRATTWKAPAFAHDLGSWSREKHLLPIFDPSQLGTRLYDMYQQLFEKEEPSYFAQQVNAAGDMSLALATSDMIHQTRETFVLFLKLVRERLEIPDARWLETMERFCALLVIERMEFTLDLLSRHDLYARLRLHGVHTPSFFNFNVPKVGPMASWDRVPSLVRIILVVPRQSLKMLEEAAIKVGTPLLQCEFRGTGRKTLDIFRSIHAAFGSITPTGTPARPSVLFNADPLGQKGSSPLIVSFIVAARLLTVDAVDKIQVGIAIQSTAGVSWALTKQFGSEFPLYSTNIMDKSHVHVLPEQDLQQPSIDHPRVTATAVPQIGIVDPLTVEMDDECELVSRLIVRVSVDRQEAKTLFSSAGYRPGIVQRSACVIQLSIGKYAQDIFFPFPVMGSENRLRLARKSLYIEVVVPISGAFRSDGTKLNHFPIVGENLAFAPWSLHCVNLRRLPVLDTKAFDISKWLKPHLAWMLSARERKLTKTHENDTLALVKDTIHTIFCHASGIAGPLRRVFALRDKPSAECDTIIFISDVRFDLAFHTLICDGYVLPLTPALMHNIRGDFGKLVQEGNIFNVGVYGDEMRAWKQLLPSFAERCRSWKHTNNCEYASRRRVPLGVEMHLDPLCTCGRGKDVEDMKSVRLWSQFAPWVTRIAMSPLFAVSYLEPIVRDPNAGRCSVCRGKGKPKMKKCGTCAKVRYCSADCQRSDWKAHKPKCKPVSS
ncbi:hypothetical protein C8F04DRAFT_1100603 [Mycena alexandri]|uniref:MYND-type domain-containing protein n=1 Tax=Mycena alexandri TaxID=1745969 RepID=A0AAD6SVN3_9AGAR|nr:hypothetical protein C8F04DRAFT_1100603 [Mycena alexandri]